MYLQKSEKRMDLFPFKSWKISGIGAGDNDDDDDGNNNNNNNNNNNYNNNYNNNKGFITVYP